MVLKIKIKNIRIVLRGFDGDVSQIFNETLLYELTEIILSSSINSVCKFKIFKVKIHIIKQH